MMKKVMKKMLACVMAGLILATNVAPVSAADTSNEAKIQEAVSNRQYYVYKLTKIMIDPKLKMSSVLVDEDFFDEKTEVGLAGVFGFQDTVPAAFGSKYYESKYYRKIMAECIMPEGTGNGGELDWTVIGLLDESLYNDNLEVMKESGATKEMLEEMEVVHDITGIGLSLVEDTMESGTLLNKINRYTAAHLNALKLVKKNAGSKSAIGKAAKVIIDATNSTEFKDAFENYMKFLGYELLEGIGEGGLSFATASGSDWASAAFDILAGDEYEAEMDEFFYMNLQNEIFSTFYKLTEKYPNALQSQHTVEEIQDLTNLTLLYLRCGQLGFSINCTGNANACTEAYRELQKMEFPWIEEGGSAVAPQTNITVSNYNVPGTISKGDYYVIFGTIESNEMIHNVKAEVTGDNGYLCATADNINSNQFDIATLDAQMRFNDLAPGSYTYHVTAATSSGEQEVLTSDFQVQAENGEMTIVGYRLPHTMNVGDVFYVTGTVNSRTPMTNVSVEIRDMSGNYMTGGATSGSYTSFDLSWLDRYVEFNKIPSGRYSYIIKATNAYGEEILVNQEYLVR